MYNMKDTDLALDVMRCAKNFWEEEDTRIFSLNLRYGLTVLIN